MISIVIKSVENHQYLFFVQLFFQFSLYHPVTFYAFVSMVELLTREWPLFDSRMKYSNYQTSVKLSMINLKSENFLLSIFCKFLQLVFGIQISLKHVKTKFQVCWELPNRLVSATFLQIFTVGAIFTSFYGKCNFFNSLPVLDSAGSASTLHSGGVGFKSHLVLDFFGRVIPKHFKNWQLLLPCQLLSVEGIQ